MASFSPIFRKSVLADVISDKIYRLIIVFILKYFCKFFCKFQFIPNLGFESTFWKTGVHFVSWPAKGKSNYFVSSGVTCWCVSLSESLHVCRSRCACLRIFFTTLRLYVIALWRWEVDTGSKHINDDSA